MKVSLGIESAYAENLRIYYRNAKFATPTYSTQILDILRIMKAQRAKIKEIWGE